MLYLEGLPISAAPCLITCHNDSQALEQLFVARRILGYSYVACFYMFDGVTFADDISPQQSSLLKNLFEDAQEMLEMEVRCC